MRELPKADRDPLRDLKRDSRAAGCGMAVLVHYGYRSVYCDIQVIDADIRKIAHNLYPGAVRWHRQQDIVRVNTGSS